MMTKTNEYGVILAGGAGTRLWPLSTKARPKQFLALPDGSETLLQAAYRRLTSILPPERIFVLTTADFPELIREQLGALPDGHILVEPARRDTGPALLLAALHIANIDPDGVMVVVTSDHLISDGTPFTEDIRASLSLAASDASIVTFGIRPTHPATGFGYLNCQTPEDGPLGSTTMRVDAFVEKPDAERATAYLAAKNYFWNSGMFAWSAKTFLGLARTHMPEQFAALEAVFNGGSSLEDTFEHLTPISVDYAIMEKAERVTAIEARFSWNDIGGFSTLYAHLPKAGNAIAHHAKVQSVESSDCLVFAEDENEQIALFGVDDLIVVRSGSKTLVACKSRAAELKALIHNLPEDWR